MKIDLNTVINTISGKPYESAADPKKRLTVREVFVTVLLTAIEELDKGEDRTAAYKRFKLAEQCQESKKDEVVFDSAQLSMIQDRTHKLYDTTCYGRIYDLIEKVKE